MEPNVNPYNQLLKQSDPEIVVRYDHVRENLEQNAINFLGYDEE